MKPDAESYKEFIKPFLHRSIIVTVGADKIAKLIDFLPKVIEEKIKEDQYKQDGKYLLKRFYTGFLGELALEIFLGMKVMDWTVGPSVLKNMGDLKKIGLEAGVKTVELGKFPITMKYVERPEVINIRMGTSKVLICGLASKKALIENQDDELILDKDLRRKGTKTGFYGFNQLKKFKSFDELKALVLQ